MIAYLNGEVAEKDIDEVTLEVAGVGYAVRVTAFDSDQLQVGQKAKLYIHENIKEDVYDLYGFAQVQTRKLFRQLLGVKNVGPKVALGILGIGSEQVVREAIASGDVKRLQTAKGVGKRAAEQIVVELRDKVGLLATDDAEGIVTRSGLRPDDEALQALLALGYTEYDAQLALKHTDPESSVEDRIKEALRMGN